MSIAKDSPHLAGALQRLSRSGLLSPPYDKALNSAFRFALENGGRKELDYRREEGVSFNPRPARIALILINDAGVNDPLLLLAAILASVDAARFNAKAPHECEARALAAQAGAAAATIADERVKKIALALHLDRARHLHLCAPDKARRLWPQFLAVTEEILRAQDGSNARLVELIRAWKNRFENTTRASRLLSDNEAGNEAIEPSIAKISINEQ